MAGHKAVEIAHSDRRYQTAPRWYPAVVSALLLCSCLRSANAAGASVAQFSAISAQCGTAGVQVCFTLDQSGSITSTGWTSARSFVAKVITGLARQTGGHSSYSAVKFDSKTQAIIGKLTTNAAKASAAVRKAHQNRLGTFLQEGIDGCAKILATGDRTRQKLMVIVTDGQPNKPKKNPGTAALNAATNAKRAGIALITVGVGKATNPGLLKAVATSALNYVEVTAGYSALSGYANTFATRVCVTKAPPQHKAPTKPPTRPASQKPAPRPQPRPTPRPHRAPTAAVVPTAEPCAGPTLHFDDLTNIVPIDPFTGTSGTAGSAGYARLASNYYDSRLTWTNWDVIDGVLWGNTISNPKQSGYAEGVVSNNNVIFNDYGRPASIAVSSSHTLSLCSFYGTPGFTEASPLAFNVTGLVNGKVKSGARVTFIADLKARPKVFVLPSAFQQLTSIRFDTAQANGLGSQDTSKQQIVIDNMALTISTAR